MRHPEHQARIDRAAEIDEPRRGKRKGKGKRPRPFAIAVTWVSPWGRTKQQFRFIHRFETERGRNDAVRSYRKKYWKKYWKYLHYEVEVLS